MHLALLSFLLWSALFPDFASAEPRARALPTPVKRCLELYSGLKAAALTAALTYSTAARAERYYIQDPETGAIRETDGDTSVYREGEDRWQVRLYKRGESPSGNGHWGLITGRTAESVMRQLKRDQAFEKTWLKTLGREAEPELFTHFNPLGPIFIPEKAKKAKRGLAVSVLKDAKESYERIQEIRSKIETILAKDAKPTNPFKEIGKVVKEYADNLKDSQQKLRKAEKMLHDTTALNSYEALSAISEATSSVELLETGEGAAKKAIFDYQLASTPSGAWMSHSYSDGTRTYKINARLSDGRLVYRRENTVPVYQSAGSNEIVSYSTEVSTVTFNLDGINKSSYGGMELSLNRDGLHLRQLSDTEYCFELGNSAVEEARTESFYQLLNGKRGRATGALSLAHLDISMAGRLCFGDEITARKAYADITAQAAR